MNGEERTVRQCCLCRQIQRLDIDARKSGKIYAVEINEHPYIPDFAGNPLLHDFASILN